MTESQKKRGPEPQGRATDYTRMLSGIEIDHLHHIRIDVSAGRAARGRITTHQIELAVDDVAGQPMARMICNWRAALFKWSSPRTTCVTPMS